MQGVAMKDDRIARIQLAVDDLVTREDMRHTLRIRSVLLLCDGHMIQTSKQMRALDDL